MWFCGVFTEAVCCCVFIFLTCLRISSARTKPDVGHRDKVGKIEGEITLGGIFRISKKEDKNRCGKTVEVEVGIQRAEAMVYAIQEVNKDPNLLQNVTLGMEIRDSCNQETVALDESLKFILDSLSLRASSGAAGNCVRNVSKDVVGVVGASRSSISIEVANLLRLFKVPQVSYASTSAELSNINKYSYFARTVPPDTLQALAMFHIVKMFEWRSVFTVNSAGSYGEKGIEQFRKQTNANNSSVCVVAAEQVTDEDSRVDYDKIISKFAKLSPTTRVVVLFMKDNHVKKLLQSAMRKKYSNVIWIASDEWGTRQDVVENLGDYFDKSNAITITLPSPRLYNFETYFKGLNGTENRDVNPWFAQYWKQHCNSDCNTTNSYSSNYKFNDKLPYIIDAVYTFAHALHKIYKKKCPTMRGLCDDMKPVNGTELRDYIFNVSFQGKSGKVEFDVNGDSKGKYDLFHYYQGSYKSLGKWKDQLTITGNIMRLEKVNSSCSEDCDLWSTKIPKEDTPCCYRCVDCKEHQYVDGITCENCEEHERPNGNYSGCEDLRHRYIPNGWVIIVSILAALGIVSTLIVFMLFLYNVHTPLVKASGRDLIFPLLIGVLLCFIMTSFLVSKPTVIICAIQRFGIGFSFSICYASILIKTNRIARIFANQKLTKSVSFTKPHTQWVMLALLIGVEACLAIVGIMLKPPQVVKVLPTANDILVKCDITNYDYVITFSYNFLLVILCTVYSFRTRKIPSSFNEAKYLGFVMYTTCIIWIAFLPVYYGTAENYHPIALSLNATLNATTILVCLFGPKIYIIVFSPSRNIQTPLTITTTSLTDLHSAIPGNLDNPTNANTMVDIDTNANTDKATSRDQNNPNVDCSDGTFENSDDAPRRASDSICEDANSQDESSVTAQ